MHALARWSQRTRHHLLGGAVLGAMLGLSSITQAACLGAMRGPIKVSVAECTRIDPAVYFRQAGTVPRWLVENYPRKEAAAILGTYGGLLIRAHVKESQAVDQGLGDRSALFGQTADFYISGKQLECSQLPPEGLVAGELERVCCDEQAVNAPCLLKTEYVLKPAAADAAAAAPGAPASPAPIGQVAKAPDPTDGNPLLKQAHTLFTSQKVTEALVYFEKAQAQGPLDPKSLYLMGLCYYLEGKEYSKAISVLEKVRAYYNGLEGKEPEKFVRRSILLLARCYALEKDADQVGVILGELLMDPQGFQEEIKIALQHEDFGWVHSSKEYQTFLKKANAPRPR